LNPSDPGRAALADRCGAPRDGDGPVFAEPWQAQAFTMAVALFEKGLFTWTEWSATLAAEIAAAPDEEYYLRWLAALERIAMEKELVGAGDLAARRSEWDRAARATPHGQPIHL